MSNPETQKAASREEACEVPPASASNENTSCSRAGRAEACEVSHATEKRNHLRDALHSNLRVLAFGPLDLSSASGVNE